MNYHCNNSSRTGSSVALLPTSSSISSASIDINYHFDLVVWSTCTCTMLYNIRRERATCCIHPPSPSWIQPPQPCWFIFTYHIHIFWSIWLQLGSFLAQNDLLGELVNFRQCSSDDAGTTTTTLVISATYKYACRPAREKYRWPWLCQYGFNQARSWLKMTILRPFSIFKSFKETAVY